MAVQSCLHLSHCQVRIPDAVVEVPNQFILVGNFLLCPPLYLSQHTLSFPAAFLSRASGQTWGQGAEFDTGV